MEILPHQYQNDWKRYLLVFMIGVLVAGAAGLSYPRKHSKCSDYVFINRMFACKQNIVIDKGAFTTLEDKLNVLISQQTAVGHLTDAAIFFRDLEEGPVVGINEDAAYSPASLLKLPLALAYFQLAEEQPTLLEEKLLYSMPSLPTVDGATFSGTGSLVVGNSYTTTQLLHNMLAYSDNLAYLVLIDHFENLPDGKNKLLTTMRELGIVAPDGLADEVVTVHEYASLYRQLFNASFLTTKDSETVLSWLAKSDFDQGLVAGVPAGVKVANKYGIRELEGVMQLHDCGIVYYPKNPYLLCVMTRGKDFTQLSHIIRDISKTTYEAVDERRK